MIYYDSKRNRLELATEMGRGGEASIYRVRGRKDLVAKIYHRAPYNGYAQKLSWMQKHPPKDPSARPGHATIAWPLELLFDHTYHLSGYVMPYMDGTVKLINVINPSLRAKVLPRFNWKYLVRTARNLASAVKALHDRDYVIGDLNESNILVSPAAMVTLIDVDSFQVHTLNDDRIFCCPVGKPEYTPAELQGVNFQTVIRKIDSDYFALAVLIFQLLAQGSHPFRGIWMGKGEPPQIPDKIKNGWFPYNNANGYLKPPPNTPGLEMFSPAMRELFQRSFIAGHKNPARRATAQMWIDALDRTEASLVTCSKGHYYDRSLPRCPWCTRKRKKIHVAPAAKPVGKPKLSVRKGITYLGVIAHGDSTRSFLTLKNEGTAPLTGTLESDRKWLQVSISRFTIAPGEIKRLDLYATTRTLRKNPKGSSHEAAIKIQSNGGDQRLRVRIRVGVPVLQVEPRSIDFGSQVRDDVVQQSIHIKNTGTGMLTGKVSSRAPWLVPTPEQFSCLPGAGIVVTLQADSSHITDISSDGLCYTSVFVSSNGGYQTVRTQMQVVKPVLHLIDGHVKLGNINQGDRHPFKVEVTNKGAGDLRGSLMPLDGWLVVQKPSFHAGPGESKSLTVYADTSTLKGLPHGKSVTGQILLSSNDGDRKITVSAMIVASEISLKKNEIDLGTINRGDVKKGEVSIVNTGLGVLHAQISTDAKFIKIEESMAVCAPGSELNIPFSLDTSSEVLPAGKPTSCHLKITSGDDQKDVKVVFQLDTPLLNIFIHDNERSVSGYQGQSNMRFLIQNPGQSELVGTIETTVPWMQVNLNRFCIASNSMESVGCIFDKHKFSMGGQSETGSIVVASNAGMQVISLQSDLHSMKIRVIDHQLYLPIGNGTEMMFQHIPSGDFIMGDNGVRSGKNGKETNIVRVENIPSHLYLNEYWMGKFAVTNIQYAQFVAEVSHTKPSGWHNDTFPAGHEQHPVSGISWLDALAFCEWMEGITGYPVHLPTEAEWEKAARGYDGREYPWGNDDPDEYRCNYASNATTPVGHFGRAGESPFGVADMSGNVWEWTNSQSRPYPYQPDDGREDISGEHSRILRGGSWFSSNHQLRTTCRLRGAIQQSENLFGFRCCIRY